MINMLISLLIYLIHLICGLFLFSLLIYLIPFCFQHLNKSLIKIFVPCKLYYAKTKKYLIFYAHIISRVETIISIFCLQFEEEIN
jgi:Na+/pantothenate symporter